MSPDFKEDQQNWNSDNPDQESKDQKILKVIRELTGSARLLTLHPQIEGLDNIGYENTHGWMLRSILLWRGFFQRLDYTVPRLPEPLRNHERIIPLEISVDALGDNGRIDHNIIKPAQVWMSLEEKPEIYQLITENNELVFGENPHYAITGKERVWDRADLLPHVLKAVSGKKSYLDENLREIEAAKFKKFSCFDDAS